MNLRCLRFLLLACACSASAADNYRQGDTRVTGTTDPVVLRTTETAGVHVPHVIVDGGITLGDVTVSNVTLGAGSAVVGAVTQSGTWTMQPGNTANTTAWLVTGTGGTFPATQSGTWNVTNISGTISLPTGAATSAAQTTGNSSLSSIDGKITAVNTGAVVISSSALPTGAATSAAQGTGNTSLSSIDGKITAVNTGAVVISSSALPSGAATSSAQTTAQTSLTTIANSATGGSTAGASMVSSTAYEASHVLKSSAGTLISLIGYNSKASAQFVQLYNTTSVPSDTAVPICTFTVAASSNFSVDVPITGMPFGTGICVANSSTGPTKTVGSSDCFFTAVVK